MAFSLEELKRAAAAGVKRVLGERNVAVGGNVHDSALVPGSHNAVAQGTGATAVQVQGDVHGDLVIGAPSRPADSTAGARALVGYSEHLVCKHSGLLLWGLGEGSRDSQHGEAPLELAQVYIKLDTTTRVALDDDDLRDPKAKRARSARPATTDEMRPLGALEAVLRQRCSVLLGEPGSGKSTFLAFLALCLARYGLQPHKSGLQHLPGWPIAATLPIPVVLRDFARGLPADKQQPTAGDLWDFIQSRLKDALLADVGLALERALQEGAAVVLFDGLDEIAGDTPRAAVRSAVMAFADCHPRARCIVTCRTLSYQDPAWQLEGWPSFTLAPFNDQQIGAFIEAWYVEWAGVGRATRDTCRRLAAGLARAVHRPDLLALARNPLLLTQMALVHTSYGTLPEARADLYEKIAELLLWRWEESKNRDSKDKSCLGGLLEQAPCSRMDFLMTLRQLAYEVHRARGGEGPGVADIPEVQLEAALRGLHPRHSKAWTDAVIAIMKLRAGLLLERSEGVYAFPHRTFQEFLAGCHLAVQGDFAAKARKLLEEGAFWREAVLLAVGRMVSLGEEERPLMLAAELCPKASVNGEDAARSAWRAGEVLAEVGARSLAGSELGRALAHRVPHALVQVLSSDYLQPVERAAAGDTLSLLGDPRFRADAWFLPDEPLLGFVEIPAGSFVMGEGGEARRVTLPTYFIGRFPVTVAQFRAFVDKGGQVADHDSVREPATCPVRWVRWSEALAYTEWLTEKLRTWDETPKPLAGLLRGTEDGRRWRVTLPSEAEWERAARGTGGRLYPWGDEAPDASRANFIETGIGRPSPVGCFPAGATQDGIHDLSGNVWEWTRSSYEDGRDDLAGSDSKHHVARGAAFDLAARLVRAAVRLPHWGDAHSNLGFRVVVSPF